ncbi:MAG: hypothetical protein HKN12_09010, partial [Gemmatimonadetes bacterium]|nr:hypothetical protein [Gemmatimonadota bacterium]
MNPSPAPSVRTLLLVLVLLAAALGAAQDRISVFEDEVIILATAGSMTAAETIDAYRAADTGLEHPPLFDLLLRGWMVLTGSARGTLRLPSILFYVAGLGLLAVASGRRLGTRWPLLAVGALWPCTPFFAVPVHWAAFAFFVTGGMLEGYTAWLSRTAAASAADPPAGAAHATRGAGAAWVRLTLFSLALVYTSYFGWAILGLVGLHAVLTRGRGALRPLLISGGVLAAAYVPIVPEFLKELGGGTRLGRSLFVMAADAGYHGFVLGVSEAIAPWTWPAAFGGLAMLALLVAAVRTRAVSAELIAFLLLFAAGVGAGILNGKRLVVFAPFWLMLLAGLVHHGRPRAAVIGAVVLLFATGWFGLASGNFWG